MATNTRRKGRNNFGDNNPRRNGGNRSRNLPHNQPFHSKDHAEKLLANLHSFRNDGKFCDVEVIIEGESFRAHRAVLASSTPYFEAMFGGDLAEKLQPTIEIHGMSPKIFHQLLKFIYTGDLPIDQNNVQDLLSAANMLELPEAVKACCDFLLKELHPSNCVGIYQFAELYSCDNLRLEAKKYAEWHFMEVIQEDEFYDIPKDTLKAFLRSEGLSIDNEFQVFQATMNWILRDVVNRRKYIFELLDVIRLPVISPKQLDSYVESCPDLSLKVVLMKILQDHQAEMRLMQLERRLGKVYDIRMQPRMCARKSVFMIGGYMRDVGSRWSDSRTLVTVERLDTYMGVWKLLPPMHHSRSGHGVAVMNSMIYVMGGESDCMIFDNGEVYDPVINKWSLIQSMNQPRCVLGACALEGYIYSLGGWVGAEVGDTIERYDPQTDTWRMIGKMNTARYAMGVIAFQGLIYVIGGLGELSNELKLVESYNPVTNEWVTLAPMNTGRAYFGVAVLHEHIYAVGGTFNHSALRTVERYSIAENKWTEIPPLRIPRAGVSVAAVNEKLLVIGGRTPGDEFSAPITLDAVEVYDPEMNTWNDSIPMLTSRCEAAVAVL